MPAPAHSPVVYQLCPAAPEAHLFEVSCRVETPDPAGQMFTLPVWIPGSYMIREFARHIVDIRAEAAGQPLALEKLDKARWRVAPTRAPVTVHYRVYAWDLSVRTAHLDTTHAFCNGTSVFLRPEGLAHLPCRVDIQPPPGSAYADWQLATSLPRDGAAPWGFGAHAAANYEDLIDHPLEMGTFTRVDFPVRGIPHHLIVTGQPHFHQERLVRDLQAICAWQMELFGAPELEEPYLFLVMAVGSGYGGLEHRNSTALICDRTDLPPPGLADAASPEGYVRFLGLCSHEYFHRWNVKRIRPAAFLNQDLSGESYTRLLWLFEGFTSYYDDLCLVRAGVIPEATYLDLLGKTISQVYKAPGHRVQSLEDSSFDAWIKYYRQDENTPNAVVSYYAKGALVALCLDLALRRRSGGAVSLDTLMVQLWRDLGMTGRGLEEDEIFERVAALGGKALGRWLKTAVSGTEELPLARELGANGVRLDWKADSELPWLGARLAGEGSEAKLSHVLSGSPAEQAGLAAGDLLVALNGLRVTRQNLDTLLGSLSVDVPVACHYFRHDRLGQTRLTLAPAPRQTASLQPRPGAVARERRRAWLGSST
ncbi:M61 family metallopeptidase [Azovibrio restrictus]|uniref:M61 family metallopeptidase n=1 Tax=Azovibrio restrictus TaxID=146938 RepID=UPI0026F195A3|nr:PDZ domain-containing protein [Azovibrio restrictus]